MTEIIYKELSYKVIGLAYEVFNTLGFGLKEKIYADSFEVLLQKESIRFARECHYQIKLRDVPVGNRYFDFLIDDKIIVELKVGGAKYYDAYNQLYDYLKSSGLKLGIIIRFTKDGVKTKRIPNIY
jgi:GxxExxY protein